ncbi:MAG: radical SAM protein [Acidobacteriota bacterium]
MRVLLVKPGLDPGKRLFAAPPIGLGYLATAIKGDHEVAILDAEIRGLSPEQVATEAARRRADVVGFQYFSFQRGALEQCLRAVKERCPGAVTVAGGPHPSAIGAAALDEEPALDFAIRGEGERGMAELLRQLAAGTDDWEHVAGLCYRRDGRVFANHRHEEDDLDRLDFAATELLDPGLYGRGVPQGLFTRQNPVWAIVTTRGCPYPCTFCSAAANGGKLIRRRRAANVAAEVTRLHRDFGIREIHVWDDNFTFYREHAMTVSDAIARLSLPVTLSMPNGVRIDALDDEVLVAMRRAGFYSLGFGIESGVERVRKLMGKTFDNRLVKETIRRVKGHGFQTVGFFILGYPGETREEMAASSRFPDEVGLDFASFGNYTPLPGTPSWDDLVKRKVIPADYRVPMTSGRAGFAPEGISPRELEKIQRRAIVRHYLRPRRLARALSMVGPHAAPYLARRLYQLALRPA